MSCEETRKLIEAYVDGELPEHQMQAVERHLQNCPCCREDHRQLVSLSGLVRRQDRFSAPTHLQAAIQGRLRDLADEPSERNRFIPWLTLGAPSLAFGFAIAWVLAVGLLPSGGDAVMEQVIASHVRSLMADHLTDVASSDRHTVKPWFNGRLDFSPPVEDYTSAGFPLLGGRLDYLDGRPVAALVYRHRQHPINMFIWSSNRGDDSTVMEVSQQGYHLLHWSRTGLTYWVVSDLNLADLRKFVAFIHQDNPPLNPVVPAPGSGTRTESP